MAKKKTKYGLMFLFFLTKFVFLSITFKPEMLENQSRAFKSWIVA